MSRMQPRDNAGSWKEIHRFIDEFPDDAGWLKWKSMVRGLVVRLEARGFDSLFRIGQAMHQIIVSTLDHHGLTTEPRVTLEFEPADNTVRIAYSCAPIDFSEPVPQEKVPAVDAELAVVGYLRRLWCETKPLIPIPDSLNAGQAGVPPVK